MSNFTLYRTGYFADTKSHTMVHLVDDNNKPICGSKISTKKQFQFNANHVEWKYVECEKCKTKFKKL